MKGDLRSWDELRCAAQDPALPELISEEPSMMPPDMHRRNPARLDGLENPRTLRHLAELLGVRHDRLVRDLASALAVFIAEQVRDILAAELPEAVCILTRGHRS